MEKVEKSHAEGERNRFFFFFFPRVQPAHACSLCKWGRTSPAAPESPGRQQQSSQCAGGHPFLWEGRHTQVGRAQPCCWWPTRMGLPRWVSEGRRAKPDRPRRVTAAPPERQQHWGTKHSLWMGNGEHSQPHWELNRDRGTHPFLHLTEQNCLHSHAKYQFSQDLTLKIFPPLCLTEAWGAATTSKCVPAQRWHNTLHNKQDPLIPHFKETWSYISTSAVF